MFYRLCLCILAINLWNSPLLADKQKSKDPRTNLKHGQTFKDCENCPEMIVVKSGTFTMGSPKSEKGRKVDEGPQRQVTIKQLAVGRYEITNAQYATFLNSVKRDGTKSKPWFQTFEEDDDSQITGDIGKYKVQSGKENHPAVNISWYGAKAYVNWLSKKTNQTYRLLSEAEWEYVARGGSTTAYSFGNASSKLCEYGNVGDKEAQKEEKDWDISNCNDGYGLKTAAVGSFKSNPFGLYDTHGNVWEWVEDCWHKNYKNAPTNGRPWIKENNGDCSERIFRGGSWVTDPGALRSAARLSDTPNDLIHNVGFRIAKTIE